MSVIYPGNYVAHLNAYRDQGVYAIPGVEFYQAIGAAIVTGKPVVLPLAPLRSCLPDLRQDDKPRLDKPPAVPAGDCVPHCNQHLQPRRPLVLHRCC